MSSSQNGNLGLWSGFDPGENGWTPKLNAAFDALDVLVQATVINMSTATPPASPNNGDAYVVAASPTGAWAGHAGQIAACIRNTWAFISARNGWRVNNQADGLSYAFNGSAWVVAGGGGGGSTPPPVNPQSGTSYTLALTDAPASSANAGIVTMSNANANTVTVPANSTVAFPVGTQIQVTQLGAGQTSIAAESGVTIRTPSTSNARVQYSTLVLTQVAANTWVLGGDMA
ncbi:hypothetical protein R77567_01605 [Ralstonia sp. LMG 32965]|uniref:Uncharacterized protein n=1 Tax=Ralstonia flatus TaxID=3058601 RepID=A0AAD2BY24_9RALS|nr:DUF2793 domain-containing protein [Ralstonia sp. LMG 32965]MBN6211420.1 DUF2793 domain-containing protein [Ralstonia pickettii]CAJ0861974.1 hypothetical protein R77567_01605 [Ralstonia sp. LMG 32965]